MGSVKDHLGSIGCIEASIIEVKLDGIRPSSFRATSWSFSAMNVWFEDISPLYMEKGSHAEEIGVQTGVGGVVVGEMMPLAPL